MQGVALLSAAGNAGVLADFWAGAPAPLVAGLSIGGNVTPGLLVAFSTRKPGAIPRAPILVVELISGCSRLP